ncbi:MAG: FtsW/RodA/SpoVE family cell cycle protein [Bacteroidales bacterium]|nr:FtsW/RodA/SpoVE family cell cycle protein [Bacteroidales bacterium]
MLEFFKNYIKGDRTIWIILIILAFASLLAVYSSSGVLAYKYYGGNAARYLLRQLTMLFAGLVIILFFHRIPYKYFSKLSQYLYYFSVLLLGITLLWGMSLNEASRWIALPGGISFQTSDLAKIALLMYLARMLSIKEQEIKTFKGTMRYLILPILIICGLIFPANISTSILLFLVSMLLLFIGQVKFKYLTYAMGIAILIVTFFVLIAYISPYKGRVETAVSRIEAYFNPESESNFQSQQAKIAIASGGLIGKGPGNSVQRNVLPHPYSDFIYAIFVEEYGYIGGISLAVLFAVLFYRFILIVKKVNRKFGAYLVMGLGMLMVFQAFAHMAVCVRILPTTGQTLPFVSMGGTSIIFLSAAMGVILSVSREVNEIEAKKKQEMNFDENENNLSEPINNENE